MLSDARRSVLASAIARVGVRVAVAGLLLCAANVSLQNAVADGDTRTLTFHHLHTGEDITVTYMREGRYDEAALKKLDWFMRDWRKGEATHMDPRLFDILWQVYREVGATKPIEVVCGYRSPHTNAMLRGRSKSSGVAEFSQHTLGKAMDFFIPDVPLAKLREIGFLLQRGGVGFYPHSGSPFVHMDTGTIRAWPRMTYAQLQKLFPDGRTVHVANDGRVLQRYAQALAEVERRGNVPNENSLKAARAHGAISAEQERTAMLIARTPTRPDRQPSLLASLFGLGRTAPQTPDVTGSSAPVAQTRTQVASAAPTPVAAQRIASAAARRQTVAKAESPPPSALYVMASAGANFLPGIGQRQVNPSAADPLAAMIASAASRATGGATPVMAYAAERPAAALDKARLYPGLSGRNEPPPAPQADAIAESGIFARMITGAQRIDSPWIRAAMLTPSVREQLTVTRLGALDPRSLRQLFYKPAQSLALGFSEDPAGGMRDDRFTGQAVVFLATASFVRAQTALLD